jgi:cobalt-zinc-cadmium efflux system outer membrane protein
MAMNKGLALLLLLTCASSAIAQEASADITLQQLQQIALENNPTLKQAAAEVRVAEGRKQQSSLWPNPRIGYVGEEIRGGSFNGGQQGFFVEQDLRFGGKLRAAANVAEQERLQSATEAEEQKRRVLGGVETDFYEALAAQQVSDIERKLADVADEAAKVTRQLANAGQADGTDVLQAEIEAQQAEIAMIAAQHDEDRAWQALATSVGQPELKRGHLVGDLASDLSDLDNDAALSRLVSDSPAVRIAAAGVARAEAQASLAQRVSIPDLRVRVGMQQNREQIDIAGKQVGAQGFAELSMELPLFNRNQGNRLAAQAEVDRARQEEMRIKLLLRERAASIWSDYRTTRVTAERYRDEILPRAQKIYESMRDRYQQMRAAYPQVIVAQRNWLRFRMDYVKAEAQARRSVVALENHLLTDGLEAPARAGEMDKPVRETNMPQQQK